jgi:RNA polymerase sigma-70 factor, ECF subfamily
MRTLEPVPDSVPAAARAEPGDAELVRRAQLGSVAAFEQLVVRHGPALHRYLAVRLRDPRDALDAFQESLTAAWLALPRLRTPDRFWPWLVGIAVHKAADAKRGPAPATEQRDEPGRHDESALELREAIAALPDHLRDVLLLRYLVGLSEEEAAAALGVRVGTVKSRSARARAALRELLR